MPLRYFILRALFNSAFVYSQAFAFRAGRAHRYSAAAPLRCSLPYLLFIRFRANYSICRHLARARRAENGNIISPAGRPAGRYLLHYTPARHCLPLYSAFRPRLTHKTNGILLRKSRPGDRIRLLSSHFSSGISSHSSSSPLLAWASLSHLGLSGVALILWAFTRLASLQFCLSGRLLAAGFSPFGFVPFSSPALSWRYIIMAVHCTQHAGVCFSSAAALALSPLRLQLSLFSSSLSLSLLFVMRRLFAQVVGLLYMGNALFASQYSRSPPGLLRNAIYFRALYASQDLCVRFCHRAHSGFSRIARAGPGPGPSINIVLFGIIISGRRAILPPGLHCIGRFAGVPFSLEPF